MKKSWSTALPYAGVGVLATLTGMAAAHLTAALTDPSSSPVVAVGSTVIDLTPTPVKEWAIRQFGTADKPILIGSVIVVTLIIAGIAGVVARRRFAAGAAILIGLVALAGLAAMLRPLAGIGDLVPSLVAAVVGPATLWWLVRALSRTRSPLFAAASAAPSTEGADSNTDVVTESSPAVAGAKPRGLALPEGTVAVEEPDTRPSRRGVLIGSGALAGAAIVMGIAGQKIISYRTQPSNLALPTPDATLPPLPPGLEERFPGISEFQTPTAEFYRVDTNLTLPIVPVNDWTLTIDGDVDEEVTITFEELSAMRLVEKDITMTCVSNEVGGRYIGSARWLGVPIKDVLDLAGISNTKANQILSTAADGFTISTPLDVALDGRDMLVVIGMNGQALPAEHGFPVRLITPGIYGYVGGTKWLSKLTLTTYEEQEAYWTERGWAIEAPIKISSRIDTPKPLATLEPGETVIGGVAWAQTRGIAKVEVRIDGGAWQEAKLGPPAGGKDYWRQWYLPWDAKSGSHMLAVRATSKEGEVQTPVDAAPFPNGSSGIQEIIVRVA